jgi:hypothetical protein
MKLEGSRSPRWALKKCQLLATHCAASSLALVALSLTLVALGGSNLCGGFHLRALSIGRLLGNHGAILDMVAISLDVEGVSC